MSNDTERLLSSKELTLLTPEQFEAVRKLENPTILKFSNGLIMVDKSTILRFENGKPLSQDQTKCLNMTNSPVGPALMTGITVGVTSLVAGVLNTGQQVSGALAAASGGAGVVASGLYIAAAILINKCILTSTNPQNTIYREANLIDKSTEPLPTNDKATLQDTWNEFKNHNIENVENGNNLSGVTRPLQPVSRLYTQMTENEVTKTPKTPKATQLIKHPKNPEPYRVSTV